MVVMGGDFNFDPWRFTERSTSGPTPPQLVRHLAALLNRSTADLVRSPANRTPTFSENSVTSTIDHWFTSRGVSLLRCDTLSDISRQHIPLRIGIHLQMSASEGLQPRPGNLVFSSDSLRLVRAQLHLLANDLNLNHWNVNQLYGQILGCFQVYGAERRRVNSGPLLDQWTSFLTEDEKEVRFLFSLLSFIYLVFRFFTSHFVPNNQIIRFELAVVLESGAVRSFFISSIKIHSTQIHQFKLTNSRVF
jgi:hypothetical protein